MSKILLAAFTIATLIFVGFHNDRSLEIISDIIASVIAQILLEAMKIV